MSTKTEQKKNCDNVSGMRRRHEASDLFTVSAAALMIAMVVLTLLMVLSQGFYRAIVAFLIPLTLVVFLYGAYMCPDDDEIGLEIRSPEIVIVIILLSLMIFLTYYEITVFLTRSLEGHIYYASMMILSLFLQFKIGEYLFGNCGRS